MTSLGRLHFCEDPQWTSKLTFLTSLLLKFYLLLFIGFLSKFPHPQSLHSYVEEDEFFFLFYIESPDDYIIDHLRLGLFCITSL